jgi:hypothetical protein
MIRASTAKASPVDMGTVGLTRYSFSGSVSVELERGVELFLISNYDM